MIKHNILKHVSNTYSPNCICIYTYIYRAGKQENQKSLIRTQTMNMSPPHLSSLSISPIDTIATVARREVLNAYWTKHVTT